MASLPEDPKPLTPEELEAKRRARLAQRADSPGSNTDGCLALGFVGAVIFLVLGAIAAYNSPMWRAERERQAAEIAEEARKFENRTTAVEPTDPIPERTTEQPISPENRESSGNSQPSPIDWDTSSDWAEDNEFKALAMCEIHVQNSMNDPDSFKKVDHGVRGDGVVLKYRGKNRFNATVTEVVLCRFDSSGELQAATRLQ